MASDGWGDDGWGDSGDAAASDGWGDSGGFGGGDVGEKSACFKCGEEGHRKADCPSAGGDGNTKRGGCFKCKSEDHMSRDCDKPDVCRRCGEEGHRARDCEKPEETRVVEGEDGQKREIYVPTEVADDDLFKAGISQGINFDKYENIKVKCTGDNVPPPIKSFQSAGLRTLLNENVLKSGYTKPTPVQKHAIPCILQKRDLMACAQTGSGKTAAFLLPILHSLLEDGCDSHSGECPQKPQAVVVAPTRELAIQIKDEARKFSSSSVMRCVVAYGGTSSGFQLSVLMRGCNVLIATPGRLMDFVDRGKVSFEEVRYLVLDEADRMLDMGFLPEITRITSSAGMPRKGERQTLMFSATFPDEVQNLAKDHLSDYLFLVVGMVGAACDDVTQVVLPVDKFSKRETLTGILNDVGTNRTMIFVEKKKDADFLATFLSGEGLPATSIHGDRLQREREEALADFRSGRRPIIVCTGVASRGLDIKDVQHVINYDLPKDIDEYVHRIGRTGRVGNTGKATSFFDPARSEDCGVAPALVSILKNAHQEVPDFLAAVGAGGADLAGTFGGHDIRGEENAVAATEEEEW